MIFVMPDIDNIICVALSYLGYSGKVTVEFEIVSPNQMRKINFRYRGQNKPTDVLSFSYLTLGNKIVSGENYPHEYDEVSGGVLLGSILICEEVAYGQAEEYGHSIDREMIYLFVHGLLHLLGFDHENDEEKRKMRIIEEDIISQLI